MDEQEQQNEGNEEQEKKSAFKLILHVVIMLLIVAVIFVSVSVVLGKKGVCNPEYDSRGPNPLVIEFICMPYKAIFEIFPSDVLRPPNTPKLPSGPFASFPGNTILVTPTGLTTLENIGIGDSVISFDIKNKKKIITTVKQIFIHEDMKFVQINNALRATSKHPFAIVNNAGIRWLMAEELKVGDCLFVSIIECTEINHIQTIITEPTVVYNMHVSGSENYFVLSDNKAILVHNKQSPPNPGFEKRVNFIDELSSEVAITKPYGVRIEIRGAGYAITLDSVVISELKSAPKEELISEIEEIYKNIADDIGRMRAEIKFKRLDRLYALHRNQRLEQCVSEGNIVYRAIVEKAPGTGGMSIYAKTGEELYHRICWAENTQKCENKREEGILPIIDESSCVSILKEE